MIGWLERRARRACATSIARMVAPGWSRVLSVHRSRVGERARGSRKNDRSHIISRFRCAGLERTTLARARAVPRVALTPAEAAESLGCSAEFFREHVALELSWIRRGRKRFVPLVELERWVEANAETTL